MIFLWFAMVFLWFSYGFPMVLVGFPWFPKVTSPFSFPEKILDGRLKRSARSTQFRALRALLQSILVGAEGATGTVRHLPAPSSKGRRCADVKSYGVHQWGYPGLSLDGFCWGKAHLVKWMIGGYRWVSIF